jgi:hypothetical protein
LREAVSLPGCPWTYLRFTRGDDGTWAPAAGSFDGWPRRAKALKCLDPCMGSGHFVVAMFERVVALRITEEGLDEAEAVAAVVGENLFGLELDPRCTQIGAFNLALAAWRRVGHCALPALNIACSGLAPNATRGDWLKLAGGNDRLERGMSRLYSLFADAPVLGSLVNARSDEGDLVVAAFHELQPLLASALSQEKEDDTEHELAVTAQGLAKAAEILSGQFTLVATNVPYLGRGKQDVVLQSYCERVHPDAKADLATCFVERCEQFCEAGGSAALVTPQNWLFLATYQALRRQLLQRASIRLVAELGAGAFQTPLYDFSFALLLVTNLRSQPNSNYSSLVASKYRALDEKVEALAKSICFRISAKSVSAQSDCRILTQPSDATARPLSAIAVPNTGLQTGDNEHYSCLFWEQPRIMAGWVYFHRTSQETIPFGGRCRLLFWEDGRGALAAEDGCAIRGLDCRGKRGVLVHRMGDLPATLFTGEIFDQNGAAVIPLKEEYLPAVWSFLSSEGYRAEVRKLDNKVGVTPATLAKVPFDLAHWQRVAAEKYPHGLPKPFSSDPTQWLFNGDAKDSEQPLHVAVARLLGYQWPRQTGSSFPDCLPLGADGLEALADVDGIVPISPTKGEAAAAERLRDLLARTYSTEWSASRQQELLAQVDSAGASLEDWLRNGFFEQHCKLFQNRPFIWHVWDGHKSGFSALVNYHKLNHANLEKLTYAYLGDWIRRQQAAVDAGESGSDARLQAAKNLQATLKLILEGEPPFDLFVRWKPLSQQAIGWQPDLNDGVRMNIRPFVARDIPGGKKGAGVLRAKLNVKWDKDRGKEPTRPRAEYPWFWGWDEKTEDFAGVGKEPDGNRWNDCHYTNDVKRKARGG